MTDEALSKQWTQISTPAELAAAREARGMSQVDISQRIKLQIRQLDALEDGRWDALPGKSFVRGALRSYGKLLDVDVAPLLDSIGGFAEPSQFEGMRPLQASISRSSGRGLSGDGRGSTIPWVIAGLIGVVVLVLYFGSEGDSARIRSWFPSATPPSGEPANRAPPAPATTPRAAVSPAASPAAAAADPTSGSGPGAASGMPSGAATPSGTATSSGAAAPSITAPGTPAPIAPAPEASAARGASGEHALPAAKTADSNPGTGTSGPAGTPGSEPAMPLLSRPAAPPAPAASPSAGEPAAMLAGASPGAQGAPAGASAKEVDDVASVKGQIRFKAGAKDSWIEVRQADGTSLHNGLVKAGDIVELNGTPPYRLTLGNASHLQVVYDGKVQDLKPHTRPNDIARLQLK